MEVVSGYITVKIIRMERTTIESIKKLAELPPGGTATVIVQIAIILYVLKRSLNKRI